MDAFGKGGKGKGKGYGDGRCHVCGGDGHFARDYPSERGPDGKATGNDECYGCHGKGHQKTDCPTANPHLKGSNNGKGDGGNGWGKGKGYGGKARDGAKAARATSLDCTIWTSGKAAVASPREPGMAGARAAAGLVFGLLAVSAELMYELLTGLPRSGPPLMLTGLPRSVFFHLKLFLLPPGVSQAVRLPISFPHLRRD